jgi:APA family basic amino acid/polyamine antiporter
MGTDDIYSSAPRGHQSSGIALAILGNSMSEAPTGRALGFWMCTALVVGNMIASGVFLLPASLAPFGWNAVFGWLLTIAGAFALAFVFARLAHALPEAGGPYAYAEAAFGPLLGFAVAWSYWISTVVGNAAIATGGVSYLSVLFPVIGQVRSLPPLLALAVIWSLTLLNCWGASVAGRFQALTTVIKLLPLAAVLVVAGVALAHAGPQLVLPFHASDIHFGSVTAAATLTLWALLGLESATIPADQIKDPARTIPRATLFGTVFTGFVYLAVCSAVMLMLPAGQLAKSAAPLSDFLERYWGGHTGSVLALFAAISGFGALTGWVLLQGELAYVMAVRGVFPAWLARTSSNGTPVRAHLMSSVLLTLIVATNFNRSMVELFTFMLLLSTTGCLFAYLFAALAALKLQWRRQLDPAVVLTVLAAVSAVYSVWAIWGAGRDAALWGLAAFLIALPIYGAMRWSRRGTIENARAMPRPGISA